MAATIQPLKALWYIHVHVSVCSIPLVEAFKTVKNTIFQTQNSTLKVNHRKNDGYDLG